MDYNLCIVNKLIHQSTKYRLFNHVYGFFLSFTEPNSLEYRNMLFFFANNQHNVTTQNPQFLPRCFHQLKYFIILNHDA
jgi:hypothetical protein